MRDNRKENKDAIGFSKSRKGSKVLAELIFAEMKDGETIEGLALRCGISARYMSDILGQKRNVSSDILLKLRKALRIDLNDWADEVLYGGVMAQSNYTYEVVRTDGKYGIRVTDSEKNTVRTVCAVSETEKGAKEIADLCNENRLDEVHLENVIDDYSVR